MSVLPLEAGIHQGDGYVSFVPQPDSCTACADKKIQLLVLPPKSPKMNGAFERCNGAWRYEFYAVYELPRNVEAINPILALQPSTFQNSS